MQRRSVQQDILISFQQRSVGGENDPEAPLPCQIQKDPQFWMAQRLSHEMKIQIIGIGMQPV